MKSYHFSVGNSAEGAVGFCARIDAETKEDAVCKLQTYLEDLFGDSLEVETGDLAYSVDYLNVYFNINNIGASDIDEINDISESMLQESGIG